MNDNEQVAIAAGARRPLAHARVLKMIKLLHSAVWLFMVVCILLVPWAAFEGHFQLSVALIAVILMECTALAVNNGKCPLTSLAARYTEDRADNFDIFLPLWLARYNKAIFGTLFSAGALFALARWFASK